MTDRFNTVLVLAALIGLIGAGGGILAWLAPVPAGELTPAQLNMIDLADTMVKGALGAILGFAGRAPGVAERRAGGAIGRRPGRVVKSPVVQAGGRIRGRRRLLRSRRAGCPDSGVRRSDG